MSLWCVCAPCPPGCCALCCAPQCNEAVEEYVPVVYLYPPCPLAAVPSAAPLSATRPWRSMSLWCICTPLSPWLLCPLLRPSVQRGRGGCVPVVFAELESEITVSNICVNKTHLCPVGPPPALAAQVRSPCRGCPGAACVPLRRTRLQHRVVRLHDKQAA